MFGELDDGVVLFVRGSVNLNWNTRNIKVTYISWIAGVKQFPLLFHFFCFVLRCGCAG